ncbi:hypothetical protein EHS25_008145 [Saitozyma podzolica]|uniref:Uncharacterized protein n=1 Tax=Saitozyma podzolica TaxID=1890683 RepID=A0A427YNT2_9TREE|nr:hypothetical protein EHS25_008145 [Saitozyma podzolica]
MHDIVATCQPAAIPQPSPTLVYFPQPLLGINGALKAYRAAPLPEITVQSAVRPIRWRVQLAETTGVRPPLARPGTKCVELEKTADATGVV